MRAMYLPHRFVLAGFMLVATPVVAQDAIIQSPAYQECTALAASNPSQALIKADAWLKIDTSIAAQHCRAMALYGLRRFNEAGELLSLTRDKMGSDTLLLRSYITRQAARAWINDNQADKALAILSSQINDMGAVHGNNAQTAKLTSELLLDRARLNITYGKLDEATKDLDHAVSLTPINEDVLLERAKLFEKLGDKDLARSDAEVIAKLNQHNLGAHDLLVRLGAATPANAATIVPPALTATPTAPAAPANAAMAAPVTPVQVTDNGNATPNVTPIPDAVRAQLRPPLPLPPIKHKVAAAPSKEKPVQKSLPAEQPKSASSASNRFTPFFTWMRTPVPPSTTP